MGNNKKVAVLNCQNLLVVNCQKVMEINCQNLLVSTCRLQQLGLGALARKFGTSKVRIRILITKGLYSTSITREVARLTDMKCKVHST